MSTTRKLERSVLRHKYGARNVSRLYKLVRTPKYIKAKAREQAKRDAYELKRYKQTLKYMERACRPSLWKRIKQKIKEWWG